MSNPQGNPAAFAADPATPTATPTTTPTLTETFTQMSDDIRVQMESCKRGPAGQLERAWLGLMLILFRLLAELVGRAVPAWMEDIATDDDWSEGDARHASARGRRDEGPIASRDGPYDGFWDAGFRDGSYPGSSANLEPDDHAQTESEGEALVRDVTDGGLARESMAAAADAASSCGSGLADEPALDAIALRRRPRLAFRASSRGGCEMRQRRSTRPARVWTATVLSVDQG